MNIFRLFKVKKFIKICSKMHQIEPLKKLFSGKHAPLANAWLCHASQATSRYATCPAPKKLAPLTNPAYTHGLLLRNVFEEMRL